MTYVRTNWVNDQTPLNADNMNNIENGIEQALAQGGAVVITSGGSVTEKTFTIPTLTNKQVVDAHNALASGKPCIVDSQDGTEHYIVDNANGSTIAINIVYSNKLIVTYTENSGAEDANATISSVELGGGGSKLYEHNISFSGNNYVAAYITIVNSNSAIMSLSDIKLSVQNIKKSASGSVYSATFKYVTIKYILVNNNNNTLELHYFFVTDAGGVGYGEASLDNATITDTVVEL